MRWPGSGPRVEVDQPIAGSTAAGEVEVAGWALPRGAPLAHVEAALEGGPPVRIAYGTARPDVAVMHGCDPACGFAGRVLVGSRPPGPARLRVTAVDTAGRRVTRSIVISLAPSAPVPEGAQDRVPAPSRPTAAPDPAVAELRALLAGLRDTLSRDPSVLDATGLGLADALPGELVVTPVERGVLPYLDHTFDVVVVDRTDPAEAERLAAHAVVRMRAGGLETPWRAAPPPSDLPRVSVVIPVFNQSACTDACLAAVHDSWPPDLEGEVLVVDDGSTDDTAALVERWTARDPRVRAVRLPANRGFIAACNHGAAAATGEVLVFLNNDTLPRGDWLRPLLRALSRERAGAVGGTLLYPDGSLQEAGGVVFDDGSAGNFGRGEKDAAHPLFAHVREVDYCSGALLATPRELFLRTGGFDAAYAPAYYEDTDYAFRLRSEGYRVLYQPASAVVHLEGATAGRDESTGVKRHQGINRTTFAARWAAALAQQPPAPAAFDRAALHRLRSRGRHPRRALVVLPTMPEMDRESGSRRAYHLIELLVQDGWSTTVVVENGSGGERYARRLRDLGAAVYAGPETRGTGVDRLADLSELLRLEPFDVALLAFWHVAERHLLALRTHAPRTRVIVDSVDLHFLRQARGAFARDGARTRPDPLDARFADEMRRELNVYGSADAVLTVSGREAAWIDDLVGATGHALCVPDLEDAPGPARPRGERRGLLFLGNFRHPPNVDALGLLEAVVENLDPALLSEHPLQIVGNALETGMLATLARHPHVRAVGWVPSVQPYLESALVALVPLRHGAGTKRKLLQALLAGTPCVSTPVGVEGLDLEAGRDVLVAEGASGLAAGVELLVSRPLTWESLSRAGRAAVATSHGRDAVRARLQAALDSTLRRPRR